MIHGMKGKRNAAKPDHEKKSGEVISVGVPVGTKAKLKKHNDGGKLSPMLLRWIKSGAKSEGLNLK